MYSVSSRWAQNIRKGPQPITLCDVLFPGEGVVYDSLPVISGSLTISRGASTRSSGSVVIGDATLLPALNSGSPIAPYGAEIRVRTGFQYYDGTQELVPMGIFQIWSVTGSEADGNIPTVELYDRSKAVERTDYIAPKDYSGWPVQDAISDVILYAAPFYPGTGVEWSVSIDASLANFLLPGGTILDGDRWGFASDLAASMGGELYFDRNGNATVDPIPVLTTGAIIGDEVWEIDVGENGVLVDADHPISRDEIYNGVVVRGSATEDAPQPYYLATDTDSSSRTYYGGPFGKHVLAIDDNNLTTTEDCTYRALAELANITGKQASISFDAIANPALDPGDILLFTYLDGSQELHMLDEYHYEFNTAKQSGSTRSIQYVES